MKMNLSEQKMRHLGRRLEKSSGDGEYHDQMEEQRRHIVSHCYDTEKRYTPRYFIFAGILAAAATAALAVLLLSGIQREAVPFWIGPKQTAGQEGNWVEASAKQQTMIRFKGGTQFLLSHGSAARVIESNTEEVIVDLSSGEMHCKVEGNGKTRWVVRAGIYQVTVTGTVFSVNWEPKASSLNVFVTEGSVLVSGATLKPHGVALSLGDHLNINDGEIFMANEDSVSQRAVEKSSTQHTDGSVQLSTDETNGIKPSAKLVSQKKRNGSSSQIPEWKKQYAQKDYAGAIVAAKSQGLDRLSRSLGAADLWQLSKAARFALDGAAAHKLLLAVTTRFPKTSKADNATFLLGRVNEELLADGMGAKRWYEQYLSVGQNRKLSEAALGRLIGVCQRAGLSQKEQDYAKQYLSKYPKGLFAKRANSVLKE